VWPQAVAAGSGDTAWNAPFLHRPLLRVRAPHREAPGRFESNLASVYAGAPADDA